MTFHICHDGHVYEVRTEVGGHETKVVVELVDEPEEEIRGIEGEE